MMTIYEYDPLTGRVIMGINGTLGDMGKYKPLSGGQMLYYVGTFEKDPKRVYIKRGNPIDRPKIGLPERLRLKLGQEKSFTGLPPSMQIKVNGSPQIVSGRVLTIGAETYGPFVVEVDHFPWQAERMEVEVV